jgi:hypothetical protein
MVPREMPMAEIEWKQLPTPMWPEGSVMADGSGLLLEASFEQGVPTWKVHKQREQVVQLVPSRRRFGIRIAPSR